MRQCISLDRPEFHVSVSILWQVRDQLLSLEFTEIDIFLLHLTCFCGRLVSAQLLDIWWHGVLLQVRVIRRSLLGHDRLLSRLEFIHTRDIHPFYFKK